LGQGGIVLQRGNHWRYRRQIRDGVQRCE
jgi:hypothetical protein